MVSWNLFILWLLCISCPSLMGPVVTYLILMTCTSSSLDGSSQISDLKMLRRVRPSSFPSTMTVLPSGKIDYVCFWCEYDSCSSLFWPLFVRSMRVKSSEHDYQTILTISLPFDDPLTILCSPQTPFASVHPNDHNDQRLSFGSGKSPWFHHGNGEVLRLCLELMLVPSEIRIKRILLFAGVEESSLLMSDLFQGMTLSALPWGENDIISRNYVSDFAKLECSSCSAHIAQILQVVKAQVVKLQRPLQTWLAIFGICFMGNSESSHDSGSIYDNSFWPDLSIFICGPKLATSTSRHCSVSSTNLRLLKLVTISSLRIPFVDKLNQLSSRQDRERYSSTSSFSKERLIPPTSLFVRGDFLSVCKTENNYKIFSRLLPCVNARLGPVNAMTLIQMRVEVLDGVATSHAIVTNSLLFEDFETRCKFFIDWIIRDN
ncbi:hypothetical protein IGI04_018099 [Brassica rapa subsp. trilocularis]|uniref:CST complex subunit CTC1 n=1 Tax=Brassica rapa subsp. trilocularis TaxID=1813537 RepID=A0ABQ7MBY4_BRACM|nr:hypothetical protein IGI04_018099 [Brassica rapa subsp. trilocularis]